MLEFVLFPKNLFFISIKLLAFIFSWKIRPLSVSDIDDVIRKFKLDEKLKENPQ